MCGIVGCVDWSGWHPPQVERLRQMVDAIRHRGPDETGLYVGQQAGLGCARLSIVDLETGQQPITNEDETLWIVFNGEVYNHPELREGLERAGHRFTTRSDTEVILHLYEDQGPACLEQLNGQFAIAIWDARKGELFLARDRLGIRPLFYAPVAGGFLFASEIKALMLDRQLTLRFNPQALAQAFTFWAPLPPQTVFEGVMALPPGHYLLLQERHAAIRPYWQLEFPEAGAEATLSQQEAAEALRALLADATRLRLRADVPVGSYLSGGIDSTLIAALVHQHAPAALCTFSIAFEDPAFDERRYQELATAFLGTDHRRVECSTADVGVAFPAVVWHAEAPLLRTSPAPMMRLAELVHASGFKVVLTGEGADEFLGGYNIYREDKVRRFWAAQPESTWRPLLLRRLYPYIADLSRSGDAYRVAFFGQGLAETSQAGTSHLGRWRNTAHLQRFFSADLTAAIGSYDPVGALLGSLNGLQRYSPLAQAQVLEVTTFMSPYLLSSQGDRMMAAHSVEGRFPFLDHRVVAFCNRLPPRFKVMGLREKHILKQSARGLVPEAIRERAKQPYRAPIRPAFFGQPLDYVDALLAPEAVRAAGVFDPAAVAGLARKCRSAAHIGEREDMALAGILSTQLLHHLFIEP
ncbi:MAG: asparagine synthase (glutamine-hydrolyzing) [Anaerolineae bacterium]|nr:asparagine synthase (glutamine-hydrolyzing) [Anaerolineae bacterium]